MLNFEFFDAGGGNTVAAGVFIPVSDLPGIEAAELEAADPDKQSKVALSLITQMYAILSPPAFDSLGWAVSKGQPSSAGQDLVNQSYNLTISYAANHGSSTVGQLPPATIGANADVGKFGIIDLFPNATKEAAAAAVSAGVLIPTSELANYGGPADPAISIAAGEDNRDWLAALSNYIVLASTKRTVDDASAITSASKGSATGITPPAVWTDDTDPTTGLIAADLPKYSFFNVSYSITFQLLLDQLSQTFDVNHATA